MLTNDTMPLAPGFWRYSVRWGNPYTTPPDNGPKILGAADVPAGSPCPPCLEGLRQPGYATCIDFYAPPIKHWSPERKAATRKRNLEKRIAKTAPLFFDELVTREMEANSDYYAGQPEIAI